MNLPDSARRRLESGSASEERLGQILEDLVRRGLLEKVERQVEVLGSVGPIIGDFVTTSPDGTNMVIEVKSPRRADPGLYDIPGREVLFVDPAMTADDLERLLSQPNPTSSDVTSVIRARARDIADVFTPAGAGQLVREGFWRGIGNLIVVLTAGAIGLAIGLLINR